MTAALVEGIRVYSVLPSAPAPPFRRLFIATASHTRSSHALYTPTKSIPMLVMMVVGYFAIALAVNIVMRVYLQRDLWVRVLETVEVHDIGAAADVRASGELASALGEGFADGLDVAGF